MITALLLNWKRPDNLKKIISIIKGQSVPVQIFLWNNNPEDNNQYNVELQINSSKNLMCSPRWLMSGYSESEYFFSLDDDLVFADKFVIEDCYKFAARNNCGIGYTGVALDSQKNYWSSDHVLPNPNNDQHVDIIKGRFLFCNKKELEKLNFINFNKASNFRIEDDIIISSRIKTKIIPSFLCKRFIELPCPFPLHEESDHKQSRIEATIKYFNI